MPVVPVQLIGIAFITLSPQTPSETASESWVQPAVVHVKVELAPCAPIVPIPVGAAVQLYDRVARIELRNDHADHDRRAADDALESSPRRT